MLNENFKNLLHRMMMFFIFCVLTASSAISKNLPILKVNLTGNVPIQDDYKKGTLQLTDANGKIVKLNAKFKLRGATSRHFDMKPSFTMKLQNSDYSKELDSTLLNIRSCSSWILDAMAIDRICMRNRVCFDIWNDFSPLPYSTDFNGRSGTKGEFVEVYINDSYTGIYCLSDKINRKLLDLKKAKEEKNGSITLKGLLYKRGVNNLGSLETPGYFDNYKVYIPKELDSWELADPDDYACEAAWAPLKKLYTQPQTFESVKQSYNIDNLVDYELFVMTLCLTDNWGLKNQYLSIRNATKVGEEDAVALITPWDLDTSLGGHFTGEYYNGKLETEFTPYDVIKNALYPFSVCNEDIDFKTKLVNLWKTVRNNQFSVESVSNRIKNYAKIFNESGAWKRQWNFYESLQYKPLMVEDLNKEVNYIIDWYKNQVKLVDTYLLGSSTGIENIIPVSQTSAIYDLQGRKVNGKLSKGIYIQSGRKLFVP